MAATKHPDTNLGRQYRRLHARRGHRRAIVAVAHTILTTGCQLDHDDAHYREPNPDRLTEQQRNRQRRRALNQLAQLGYNVDLREAAA